MTAHTDRRAFLRTAAGSLAAASVSGLSFADDKKHDDFGGFTVGIQSYTFREFKLEPTLKRLQDLGIHYVEFYRGHCPTSSTPEQIKAVVKLCSDYGVKPIAFGVEGFSKKHDANKKLFDFGQALGVKHLSADPDPDAFDSLDKLVDEYKISIAIHPHGPAGGGKLHRWYSAEVILDAVKSHHPLIGTCLDVAHLIRCEQLGKKLDPVQQIKHMGDRNFGLHLKDHDNVKKTDVVFGKGVLDVPGCLKMLKGLNFKGYIAIEYEANPKDPFADVKECVTYLKDAASKVS